MLGHGKSCGPAPVSGMGDGPDRTLVRKTGDLPVVAHPVPVQPSTRNQRTERKQETVQLAAPPPRLYRAADGRVVAGVAQGLANHLAVKPLYVRIAFAVLGDVQRLRHRASTWRCGR